MSEEMALMDIAEIEVATPAETARLCELERVIERGLNTFVEVGNALMEIREARLYRSTHGTFEAYCVSRWNLKRQRAYELIEAAQVIGDLSQISDKPKNEAQAAALAVIEPAQRAEVWQRAVETAPEGKITARHVSEVVQEFKRETAPQPVYTPAPSEDKPAHFRTQFTGENEWYTPAEYINAAREFMGGIDLDPATSEAAQDVVQASYFYTIDDDGLKQDWFGRVWLNPPFAQPHIQNFVEKMVAEVRAGKVKEAVMLTHNYTDTYWFHHAEGTAGAICFTRGRVKFYSPSGEIAAPTQGQAFFYFGPRVDEFKQAFKRFGFVR